MILAACGGTAQSGKVVTPGSVSDSGTSVPFPAPTPTPSPTATPTPAETAVTLADDQFYSKGSYIAYPGPWCALFTDALKVGTDLDDSITLYPSTFPAGTVIETRAPHANPNDYGCGVYGYHHLAFGNYAGGVPRKPVEPSQVDAIDRLVISFDIASQEAEGDYNILNETFLTNSAGNAEDKKIEIGYFLHASSSAIAFAEGGTSLGDYTDPSGSEWTIHQQDKFVMLLARGHKDVESGTLDMKHLMHHLRDIGLLDGKEWFNGVAIGVEPVSGQSKVAIAQWAVAYN